MRSTRLFTPARPTRRTLATTLVITGVLGAAALSGATSASAAVRTATTAYPASFAYSATPALVTAGPSQTMVKITADAQATLDSAHVALDEASKAVSDVATSGLAVEGTTTIDTTELRREIDRISNFDVLPTFLLPGVTDAAADATQKVTARTTDLRTRLETARAQKAAEEAAAAAAAEAQRQAEAAAAALAAANTPEGAKATARQIAASEYGWGADQFSCLEKLWTRESSWNYQSYNSGSGATGIPQALPGSKMASAGSDWQTNATTQIRWGLGYIRGSYGTPCAAWGHSNATNWY
ncbi:phospholipase [Microbacterium sp. AZCO]|uniref:aggregation-promoting factor C-terminal-like domain-containing protein n=1 Tax=Microbacterium sp. AZCO TaxID=3142976 RepID=UPI0031F37EE7